MSGNVKLRLSPRQSRGVSHPTNERWDIDVRNIVLGLNVDSAIFAKVFEAVKGE